MSVSETRPVVFDATCTPDVWLDGYPDWLMGGFTGCAFSCNGGSAGESVARVARALRVIGNDPRLTLATDAAGIRRGAREERLAVVLHFQSPEPFEQNVDLVEAFARVGVRMVGLAYNTRGTVCDGCEEPDDRGVSGFGRRVIAELNRVRVLVDLSHVGARSSREAIELSTEPCIASHSNARVVCPHVRNLPDDVIRAIAGSGGVIGLNGFPAFVAPAQAPTLDQFIDHIVHIDTLVGTGHVGLGLDYCTIAPEEYDEMLEAGVWRAENYPPPPWRYPAGIETARTIGALADRMSRRGFSGPEVDGVLGANWLRVFDRVWG